jgi:hypothetical protein
VRASLDAVEQLLGLHSERPGKTDDGREPGLALRTLEQRDLRAMKPARITERLLGDTEL